MFFKPVEISLQEIASLCEAETSTDQETLKNTLINNASPIEAAGAGAISFIDNPKYLQYLDTTQASAVFCSEKYVDMMPESVVALVHKKPYQAYGKALSIIYPTAMKPQPVTGETGISKAAHISPGAEIEADVIIEAGAVIGRDASIGSGSVILSGAVIGEGVTIGRNTTIGANATLVCSLVGDNVIVHNGAQIGQDGFGFAMGPGGHHKVPQIGRVIIQDKVEIGANSTIDRGANRDTIIGEGTKIDNLVQIGHNSVIGRHCVIVGLVGISGSVTMGDYVVVAGQAGVVGHTTIGSGAQIGGGSGVHGDVPAGARVMGYPAISASKWMRNAAKVLLAEKRERKKKKGDD
ncbi:MAG: UDP-3-O-(3-hydroxymyristoyl)glucosamine N-acyltransferase [Pseudomonadota bacterium]